MTTHVREYSWGVRGQVTYWNRRTLIRCFSKQFEMKGKGECVPHHEYIHFFLRNLKRNRLHCVWGFMGKRWYNIFNLFSFVVNPRSHESKIPKLMLSYKYELQHNFPYTRSYLSHHMIRITATSMTLMAGFFTWYHLCINNQYWDFTVCFSRNRLLEFGTKSQ